LEFPNDSSSFKGSDSCYQAVPVLPLEATNGKIVSTKLLPLMNCKKASYFLRIGAIHLEKYPKIKGTFYLCPHQVRYCMELTQNQECFCPICKHPTSGNFRGFGVIFLVAQRYVG